MQKKTNVEPLHYKIQLKIRLNNVMAITLYYHFMERISRNSVLSRRNMLISTIKASSKFLSFMVAIYSKNTQETNTCHSYPGCCMWHCTGWRRLSGRDGSDSHPPLDLPGWHCPHWLGLKWQPGWHGSPLPPQAPAPDSLWQTGRQHQAAPDPWH